MTYTLPTFGNQNTEGVDFTLTYQPYSTTAGDPVYPGFPFTVGTVRMGSNGSRWCFVTANGALTAGMAVGINMTTFTATALTKALADAGNMVGFAQIAIADTYGAWVQIQGSPNVQLKNGCLPAVPLFTTASAGMLDDTSASQTRVYGIRAQATAATSGASKLCWAQNVTV